MKLAVCSLLFLWCAAVWADAPLVHVIQIDDQTINPVTSEYILRSIDQADEAGAACLVIQLDTPGGLLTSTRAIVKKILDAPVPVVVYVYPKGSRAGSAGVFISYASHVLAMAPSTNIGAAHPVQIGGRAKGSGWKELAKRFIRGAEQEKTEKGKRAKKTEARRQRQDEEEPADPMSEKILQDTVAFIKAIAKEKGRNVEWAIKSVVESASITSEEARRLGVIEIIAQDQADLLDQLHGRTVLIRGKEQTLQTQGATVRVIPMDFRQRFLNVLANPNIAYILLMLGFYGLLFEVTHPGFGVPGVLGIIFIIMAFFGMQMLPTNYAGLALLVLGVVLFVFEVMAPGLGLLTLGGLICLVLGSFLLFEAPDELMRVSWSLIFSFTAATAVITLGLIRAVLASQRRKKIGSADGLVGKSATVRTGLHPGKEGKVFVHGELWNAVSEDSIRPGQEVRILKLDGMLLTVKKVSRKNR